MFTYGRLHPLECDSLVFNIFNYHHNLISEHFHQPKENCCIHYASGCYPQPHPASPAPAPPPAPTRPSPHQAPPPAHAQPRPPPALGGRLPGSSAPRSLSRQPNGRLLSSEPELLKGASFPSPPQPALRALQGVPAAKPASRAQPLASSGRRELRRRVRPARSPTCLLTWPPGRPRRILPAAPHPHQGTMVWCLGHSCSRLQTFDILVAFSY